MKPKLLLHSCCGPCVINVIRQLSENYQVAVYYFNPNIHPRREYLRRRNEVARHLAKTGSEFIEGAYDTAQWFELTKGLANEPEKGRRCDVCFEFRLTETIKYAKENNFSFWATSLSISPHKNYQSISQIGQRLAKEYGLEFVDHDWKKKDGYKQACQLAREENFYRQNYCGCVYSRRDKN